MSKENLLEKMERKLAVERKQEQLDQVLKDAKRLQITEKERADLTKRSNDRKILRHRYIEQKELEQLDIIDREKERKNTEGTKKYMTDEKLAQQMDLLKREEIRDIKLRQHLRENDPELREFQRQLRQAYAAKELAFQIAQKKAEKLEEEIREKQANDAFNILRASDVEFEVQKYKEDSIKKAEYLQTLQNQMLIKEREKKDQFEHYLAEKQIIDDVAKRIQDENESETLRKAQEMKKAQEEMKQFKAAREAWRQKEIDQMKAEHERIEKYWTDQKALQKQSDDAKRLKEEAKERLVQQIGRQMHDRAVAREERNILLLDLMEEEAKEIDQQRAQAEIDKKIRDRVQLSNALELQIKEKEDKLKKECEEDFKYRQQLTEKIMEEERVYQMGEQRRRRKMIEVRKTVEKMMLEKQQQRAIEIQKMWRLKEIEKEEEMKRREKVDFERVEMLKENVKNLVGFIPKGLLKGADLQHLGDDVVQDIQALSMKTSCP